MNVGKIRYVFEGFRTKILLAVKYMRIVFSPALSISHISIDIIIY